MSNLTNGYIMFHMTIIKYVFMYFAVNSKIKYNLQFRVIPCNLEKNTQNS